MLVFIACGVRDAKAVEPAPIYDARNVAAFGACDTACDTAGDCKAQTAACDACGCPSGDACGGKSCDGCCQKCGCGGGKKKKKPNPCATSHKVLFFDNDFDYLCDPKYSGHCLGDALKANAVGHHGRLDIGGQWRLRYHHEKGMNKGVQRFLDTEDNFLLNRLRLYADYHANDWLRVYAEGIYADSYGESLPPRLIDVNNGDLLNAFVDVKLLPEWTVRVGRQELLYGAQRLVSPLDWANTRRKFDGIKMIWRPDGDWAVDAFYTQFVPVRPDAFDIADNDLNFYGAWATYSGFCDSTVDFYHLGFDNQRASTPASPNNSFSLQTTGARLIGERDSWLWELQGGYQWGDAPGIGRSQSEGFGTVGLGRKFKDHLWTPTLWAYFDYASPGYNQLFPLAHKYLGFIDAVQRSNVQSPNVLLTAKPHKKVTLLAWYYYFMSANSRPIPSVGGTPAQDPSSRDFGQELDFIVKYQIKPRSDVLVGYSHLWKGKKILNPNDADFVYVQWTLNF